ncbi:MULTISPECIES: hypothetical protein [Rhizobium]|uniref:hypothetical protein n=1 Tax=Rhizobium TaxID=379 RepID=UPI001C91BD69|nr:MULTISPECIES: hypothetical protein [Rhizobium]MBY3081869.1 hypothetical protein [Rhizobium laguerreae]MBY3271364.1 hypothetical protein [Rhizobium laguerreae]MBY3294453.1 hypothetical protein [Rhizobium laguerreae]MBY3327325.1 hypothetical protein [Rhizobium laguerreae]MBY3495629.1 hypothetical protein [Rhizobium laguerreae]
MANGVVTVGLDQLFAAALTGKSYNEMRLGKEAHRYARVISKARASDLPDDLHDEIFQQAFTDLWEKGSGAIATVGGKEAFRTAVIAAIRTVRANYAPAGEKTRRSASKPGHGKVSADQVQNIATAGAIAAQAGEGAICLAAQRAADQVECSIDAHRILEQAPEPFRNWMHRLHFDDDKLEAIAKDACLSRFALRRRLETFYEGLRQAA